MKIRHIIEEIEKAGAEPLERTSGRREMLSSFGTKVALAALPFGVASLFKKASAKTTGDAVVDALNLILELKYMQYTYYHQGINTTGLISANDMNGFKAVEAQEASHIGYLKNAITELGGVVFEPNYYSDPTTVGYYVPAAYDFTAGGAYHPFSDYPTFLLLAQLLEDTGVHALIGQASALLANNGLLVDMMRIQGAEARHASYVRLVRRLAPISAAEEPAPWITNNIPPASSLQTYYDSEDNVQHNGVILTSLPNIYYADGKMPQVSATAAFDEGYAAGKIQTLITRFKRV